MAAIVSSPERVFVSYSHEGDPHDALVLNLTDQLRNDGIEAVCDQYCPHPPEGWLNWMETHIQNADFVLIICTDTYRHRLTGAPLPSGKGVIFEFNLINQLIYNAAIVNSRLCPCSSARGDRGRHPSPIATSSTLCS